MAAAYPGSSAQQYLRPPSSSSAAAAAAATPTNMAAVDSAGGTSTYRWAPVIQAKGQARKDLYVCHRPLPCPGLLGRRLPPSLLRRRAVGFRCRRGLIRGGWGRWLSLMLVASEGPGRAGGAFRTDDRRVSTLRRPRRSGLGRGPIRLAAGTLSPSVARKGRGKGASCCGLLRRRSCRRRGGGGRILNPRRCPLSGSTRPVHLKEGRRA